MEQKKYYEHSEWLDNHLSEFYDNDDIKVFHEISSTEIHLDVYFINAEKHNFNILLTCGMSTKAMNVNANISQEEKNELKFAELMMLLPKDISFENIHNGDNPNDWIISMLKQTARFPHEYNTWIGTGHTLQATYDMEPYNKNTSFVGNVILPSVTFEEDFMEINKQNRKINIYSLFPLYRNELEYKIEHGYDKFLDLLIDANAKEIFDNSRENLVKE